jgi:hypothetical protein
MKLRIVFLKLILALLLSIFFVNLSSGQALIFLYFFGDKFASEELHLSTDGGINLSHISDLRKGEVSLGLNFGLSFHVRINDRWQVIPQFRPFSLTGVKDANPLIEVPSDFDVRETDFTLNHLDFPVLFRYRISKVLFVSAGPQISFLNTAKQKSAGRYLNEAETLLRLDVKEYFNKISYSFPLEMGYWFRLPDKNSIQNTKISVFMRYCPGLNYAFKDTETFGDIRISTLQVGVSFSTINN